ncbi:transposase [Ensifer sp. NBAIM29]|nr:transposase [Ensifer sp. NBAIM29]
MEEVRCSLADRGLFFEQNRPDILKRRQDWFDGQLDLDPEHLVFIDETWVSTNMARRYGRSRKGERLRISVPHGHWKTTTFLGALTVRGFIAPLSSTGSSTAFCSRLTSRRVLLPELRPGDVVVLDNLSSQGSAK